MADEEGHPFTAKDIIELHRASSTAPYTRDLWFLLFRGIIEQGYQLSTGEKIHPSLFSSNLSFFLSSMLFGEAIDFTVQ